MAKNVLVRFLGYKVSYAVGMAEMQASMLRVQEDREARPELLLVEHNDVITITRQHGRQHVLISDEELAKRGIEIIETNRGGDVTFHGLGQLVGYPVMRVPHHAVVLYVRTLEEGLLSVCRALGVQNAGLICGKTGVWVDKDSTPKKLIAIGVGLSKGVTRHGFALNITTDLERFTSCIIPCGLHGMGVTSLERELKRFGKAVPSFEEVLAMISDELCLHLQKLQR